jgi:hypothetical protein
MQSHSEPKARREENTRSIETKRGMRELEEHLKEIIDGEAFRGSRRSGQFLTYVVEHALVGDFDSLKERSLGIELFGRDPSYDTGGDAIVRVTASDVRKRLQHHYSGPRSNSNLRINIPPGSYVPEIVHQSCEGEKGQSAETAISGKSGDVEEVQGGSIVTGGIFNRWILLACAAVVASIIALAIIQHVSASATPAQTRVLPWSAFFGQAHPTMIVTSDPNIAESNGLIGTQISISDYANRRYIPETNKLSAETAKFCREILRGDKTANVDIPIVAGIAELAGKSSEKLNVRAARDFRLSDLDADNNIVFLGSPRTNPWTELFNDQLDFRFSNDNESGFEVIRNAHPQPGEPDKYVPTAKGFATGHSFATISLVRNPNHYGQVIILAGANAEATKAAGELALNTPEIGSSLQRCGIRSFGKVQHFQLLLSVSTMAGSPGSFSVLACHVLP